MTTPDQPTDRGICGAHIEPGGFMRAATCELLHGHTGWHRDGGMSWVDVAGADERERLAYERGKAEGIAEQRRERTLDALANSEWSDLRLQHEDEQWSVWWTSIPGGGLNVTMPTEDEADHEAACRSWQADHGGVIKRRTRVTLVGEWHVVEAEPARGGVVEPRPVLADEDGCTLTIPPGGTRTGPATWTQNSSPSTTVLLGGEDVTRFVRSDLRPRRHDPGALIEDEPARCNNLPGCPMHPDVTYEVHEVDGSDHSHRSRLEAPPMRQPEPVVAEGGALGVTDEQHEDGVR